MKSFRELPADQREGWKQELQVDVREWGVLRRKEVPADSRWRGDKREYPVERRSTPEFPANVRGR